MIDFLIAATLAAAPVPVTADTVIAAERAFSARHQEVSVKQAFQEYSADDGVSLEPGGVRNVKTALNEWPDKDNKGFILWWPSLAGMAQSGDLGFTTGPASYAGGKAYGDYFTVWKKQADGSWKWMIDLGTGPGRSAIQPSTDVMVVPTSTVAPMDAAAARTDLLALDTALGTTSAVDMAAVAPHYAAEIRLLGYEKTPVNGLEAARATLARRAADLVTKPEGGDVSAAGDLGYTYGFAKWTVEGGAKTGAYLRVWQRRANGWVVLAENVAPF